MAEPGTLRSRVERLTSGAGLPDRQPLPRHLAPVPERVENLGLRLAWLVVGVNLLGTAFGFWYYRDQFAGTAWQLWPIVPDSPTATLLFAAAVGAWLLGRPQEWLTALAFVGNVVLGLWTPITLLAFLGHWGIPAPMWHFLFWSHLAMVVQAFVLHRIADFPPRAVGVAVVWYGTNLVVDYFVPVLGDDPHHTLLPVAADHPVALGAGARDVAGATAVVLTLAAVYLALTIGIAKRRARRRSEGTGPSESAERTENPVDR